MFQKYMHGYLRFCAFVPYWVLKVAKLQIFADFCQFLAFSQASGPDTGQKHEILKIHAYTFETPKSRATWPNLGTPTATEAQK